MKKFLCLVALAILLVLAGCIADNPKQPSTTDTNAALPPTVATSKQNVAPPQISTPKAKSFPEIIQNRATDFHVDYQIQRSKGQKIVRGKGQLAVKGDAVKGYSEFFDYGENTVEVSYVYSDGNKFSCSGSSVAGIKCEKVSVLEQDPRRDPIFDYAEEWDVENLGTKGILGELTHCFLLKPKSSTKEMLILSYESIEVCLTEDGIMLHSLRQQVLPTSLVMDASKLVRDINESEVKMPESLALTLPKEGS